MARVIGIDPGRSGGIVALDGGVVVYQARGQDYHTHVARQDPSGVAMWTALVDAIACLGESPELVVLETPSWHAGAGRRMSAGVAGRLGVEHGLWRGIIVAHGWPLALLRAQEWRSHAGITVPRGTDAKAATIAHVGRRLPTLDLRPGRCTKPHDGLADAAGMALAALGQVTR